MYVCIYIYRYMHGGVFTWAHAESSVANAHMRWNRTKYEYPSFSIRFRLFENNVYLENAVPCGLCGPTFPGMQQICVRGWKQK